MVQLEAATDKKFTYPSGARPLDGYTIRRAVGRGGFGEVYYATSDGGKEVALKLIQRNLDIELRGVTQCMNLKSPHLVTIYDLRTNEAGDHFVIMEYVVGESLAQILQRHPQGLPHDQAVQWFAGIAEGIGYLHNHGIVHRDLKPANIFLENDAIKIGDYGLSKFISCSRHSGQTESVGTVHYMAPEIATGNYNKQIDVYAAGIILHEMLTGTVPFDGESIGEILMKHLTARPDLGSLPRPFDVVVAQALSKEPAQRYESMAAMLAAVRGSVPGAATPHPVSPAHESRGSAATRRSLFWWPLPNPARPAEPVQPSARPTVAPPLDPGTLQDPSPFAETQPVRPQAPAPVAGASGRLRVAELASSMALASVLAAIFSLLAVGLVDPNPERPKSFLPMTVLTTLGVWGILVPAKFWENTKGDEALRRIVMLVIGLLVGCGGWSVNALLNVGLPDDWKLVSAIKPIPPGQPLLLASGYFGLMFLVLRWWRMAAPRRQRRFNVMAIFWAGLWGLVVSLLFAFPQPIGVMMLMMMTMIVQLVSPWEEPPRRVVRRIVRYR